jgi:uncharacterized protein
MMTTARLWFLTCVFSALFGILVSSHIIAQTPVESGGVIRLQDSPYAQLQSVDMSNVHLTKGFWADRFRQTHEVTLHTLWDLLADPEAGHILDNMKIAGGLQEGEFSGVNWQDAWLYKWLEAAASIYQSTRDPWIAARMDEAIELIAQAQEDDGYISTQITVTKRKRWQDPRDHEVYVMGHLITAACVHHRVTGKRTLLDVAIRAADFLCKTLGVTVNPSYAHNPTAVMGMVELYRETGQKKYLDCAQTIVDARGADPKPGGVFYQGPGVLGTDLFQDRVPYRKETEIVGHNVFFTYLNAGVADIYLETGDKTLRDPMNRLWDDLVLQKMCINGGVSPMGHGLSPRNDPIVESVGVDYYLPSADSYNETCGQIGNMMWNYRMMSIKPDVKYTDMMEREFYNGFLGGIGLDGKSWFYRNALRRYDVEHAILGHNDMIERGLPGKKRTCCPSNLLRALAQVPNYIYSLSDDGLWVHQYTGNVLDGKLKDGSGLKLTQETDYPWDGLITLTVDAVESKKPFAVKLRIPEWAEGATLSVNGAPVSAPPMPGQYAEIHRQWKTGDSISLNLPMNARLMQAHPKAEQLRNQVAIMRGPVLYCLESPDMAGNIDLNNVYIPSDLNLQATQASELPFGIMALEGNALYRGETSWNKTLYRTLQQEPLKPLPLRMIPYFAWNNRGPSAMTVWMPVVLKN